MGPISRRSDRRQLLPTTTELPNLSPARDPMVVARPHGVWVRSWYWTSMCISHHITWVIIPYDTSLNHSASPGSPAPSKVTDIVHSPLDLRLASTCLKHRAQLTLRTLSRAERPHHMHLCLPSPYRSETRLGPAWTRRNVSVSHESRGSDETGRWLTTFGPVPNAKVEYKTPNHSLLSLLSNVSSTPSERVATPTTSGLIIMPSSQASTQSDTATSTSSLHSSPSCASLVAVMHSGAVGTSLPRERWQVSGSGMVFSSYSSDDTLSRTTTRSCAPCRSARRSSPRLAISTSDRVATTAGRAVCSSALPTRRNAPDSSDPTTPSPPNESAISVSRIPSRTPRVRCSPPWRFATPAFTARRATAS